MARWNERWTETLFLIIVLALAFWASIVLTGCAHCQPKTVVEVREVRVPVPVEGTRLPVPGRPEFEIDALEDQEMEALTPLEAVRIITRDFLRALQYGEELRAVLEAHNLALGEPGPN